GADRNRTCSTLSREKSRLAPVHQGIPWDRGEIATPCRTDIPSQRGPARRREEVVCRFNSDADGNNGKKTRRRATGDDSRRAQPSSKEYPDNRSGACHADKSFVQIPRKF